MSSRSVVKSQRRPQAVILGTTRSAEASWKYLLGCRLVSSSACRKSGEDMNIRWLNAVTIPRDAKHSIAGGFGNEGVCSTFARIGWNDIFHPPVATEITSDAYMGVIKPVSRWNDEKNEVPCKGVPSVVYIIASQPGSNSTIKFEYWEIQQCKEKTYTGPVRSLSIQVGCSP